MAKDYNLILHFTCVRCTNAATTSNIKRGFLSKKLDLDFVSVENQIYGMKYSETRL